jgi:hypothetical protein
VVKPFALNDKTISSMPGQPVLSLLDDLRLERGLGVAGHLDGDRPDLGEHGYL